MGEIVIRINSHPSMSTTLSPGHNATNQIHKYAWSGCNVAISSVRKVHLYMVLCKHYGARSGCYFIVIWEQPYQGS